MNDKINFFSLAYVLVITVGWNSLGMSPALIPIATRYILFTHCYLYLEIVGAKSTKFELERSRHLV